jgi:NAD(P)H-hydrate epimerase
MLAVQEVEYHLLMHDAITGGDGLVAARHLFHFGYQTAVYYPKRSSKQLFVNLVHQLEQLDITMLQDLPDTDSIKAEYQLIVDAIFGFSFSGGIRSPFDSVIRTMKAANVPIASVDIPSGWDVNTGYSDTADSSLALQPEFLCSLTAPKPAAALFQGKHHYLGGRFLPPSMAKQYDLEWLPCYPGTEQCVKLN